MTLFMPDVDDIAYASGANKRPPKSLDDFTGKVTSLSPFKVNQLGAVDSHGEPISVEVTPLNSALGADIGDYVYVVKRKNGHLIAIDKIGGQGGNIVLLWENTNLSATFTSTTLNIDWSPYKFLFFENYTPAGGGLNPHTEISVVSTNDTSISKFVSIVRETMIFRRVELGSGTIYISTAYWYREWNGSAPEQGNPYLTPYRIYGVRELGSSPGGGGGGGGGTDNYNNLTNKPTITEPIYGTNPAQYSTVVIQGDQTFDDLGMHPLTNTEINDLITTANAIQGV